MTWKSTVLLAVGLAFFATLAEGAWVGVLLFQTPAFDHIHVSVSEDKDWNHASMLNVWNEVPSLTYPLKADIEQASRWVMFWHEKSKAEIVEEWEEFYLRIKAKRFLFGKNCAYATRYLLNNILALNIGHPRVLARWALFLWLPSRGKAGIPIPETVFKQLKRTLAKDGISYFSKTSQTGFPVP